MQYFFIAKVKDDGNDDNDKFSFLSDVKTTKLN